MSKGRVDRDGVVRSETETTVSCRHTWYEPIRQLLVLNIDLTASPGRADRLQGLTARALVLAAISLLPLLATACGGPEPLPAELQTIGLAAYQPIPADALPIREADRQAVNRAERAAVGIRYLWSGERFDLSPASPLGVDQTAPTVRQRQAIRVGSRRVFAAIATVPAESRLNPELRDELEGLPRREVEIEVLLPRRLSITGREATATSPENERRRNDVGGDEGGPLPESSPDPALERALLEAVRATLRDVYRRDTRAATGTAWIWRVEPLTFPDPERLPRDPDAPNIGWAYRSGVGLRSVAPDRLVVRLLIVLRPDVPLDRR